MITSKDQLSREAGHELMAWGHVSEIPPLRRRSWKHVSVADLEASEASETASETEPLSLSKALLAAQDFLKENGATIEFCHNLREALLVSYEAFAALFPRATEFPQMRLELMESFRLKPGEFVNLLDRHLGVVLDDDVEDD